jgi:transposase
MRGRTSLSRALIKTIVELVWKGFSDSEIRQRIGVPKSTWNDWRRRGESDTRGIFHDFSVEFNRAAASFAHSLYETQIKRAQEGDLAAATFLADRHPRLKDYRKKTHEKIESDHKLVREVGIGFVIATDEELNKRTTDALRRYKHEHPL